MIAVTPLSLEQLRLAVWLPLVASGILYISHVDILLSKMKPGDDGKKSLQKLKICACQHIFPTAFINDHRNIRNFWVPWMKFNALDS